MNNPAPAQIKQARKDAGLTQTAAADLIYKSCRAWQQYEKGDRAMDLALFELFMIKVEKCK
jgi:DNA-binding XRE family transcriptional regulator